MFAPVGSDTCLVIDTGVKKCLMVPHPVKLERWECGSCCGGVFEVVWICSLGGGGGGGEWGGVLCTL